MALKLRGDTVIDEAGKTLLELTNQITALQKTVNEQATLISNLTSSKLTNHYALNQEVEIGTCSDGHKVYRKIVTFSLDMGTANNKSVTTGISAPSCRLLGLQIIVNNNINGLDGGWRNIPWLFTNGSNSDGTIDWRGGAYIARDLSWVAFQCGKYIGSTSDGYLVLTYTK